MIANILQHTPVWVWALFCGLLALGILQTRTRTVSKARATLLPIVMVLLSLNGVLSAFGPMPVAIGAWIVGLLVTLRVAAPWVEVRGGVWLPENDCFRVPGSWIPVSLIVAIFVTKYAAAVVLAMHPELAMNATVAGVLSLVYGSFAGLFWGRARSLLAHSRAGRAVVAA